MSASRFPQELLRAQRQVWASEAASRAFVLAGPDSPVAQWPLPRQEEYRRLRAAHEQALRAVREHPLMVDAIEDHHWAATIQALSAAARAEERMAAA
ncbi:MULTISPECIES: hypothetical protein [Streptacidiphilus]|uniref:Uncharacterized protein n=2 Tax=Streptacidiphilus TaxID=228398 RepID=A0ABV6UND9_9ACTN|nr:hypothetical protein [Streptacidiphilus jeojiense]